MKSEHWSIDTFTRSSIQTISSWKLFEITTRSFEMRTPWKRRLKYLYNRRIPKKCLLRNSDRNRTMKRFIDPASRETISARSRRDPDRLGVTSEFSGSLVIRVYSCTSMRHFRKRSFLLVKRRIGVTENTDKCLPMKITNKRNATARRSRRFNFSLA